MKAIFRPSSGAQRLDFSFPGLSLHLREKNPIDYRPRDDFRVHHKEIVFPGVNQKTFRCRGDLGNALF